MGRGTFRRNVPAGAVLAAMLAAGCQPIVRNHGYTPPDYELAQIQVGRDTRESVAEAIGAPLHYGLERDEAWLYISSRNRSWGLRAPQTFEREVVAIRFAESGTVANVERFGLEDGRVVVLSTRVTDPSVSEIGLLRQIFGNLGTPTADQFLEP